jgi:hypothetical protein
MNPQTVREVRDLPMTTAEADVGPIVEYSPGRLTVRYDVEAEGGLTWTTIQFGAAVAFRFTPDEACEEWMIEAYSRICEVLDSEWLRELASKADSTYEPMRPGLHHWMVYFDHHGCVEVLADSFDVD